MSKIIPYIVLQIDTKHYIQCIEKEINMYSKENPLKLKVINCKNYIYIANEDYFGVADLTRYLFDGEVPEKTNKDRWFKNSYAIYC